jgi:hypothetical protein
LRERLLEALGFVALGIVTGAASIAVMLYGGCMFWGSWGSD